MAYTLLQLTNQVMGELGLTQTTSIIGSSNNLNIQLLALAQRLGKDLARDYEWQRLVKAYVFTTTTAVSTTGTLTANSSVIASIPSTSSIEVGNVVTGTGVAPYAQVQSVDSSVQITLDTPVTTSTSSSALKFAKQDYDLPADYDSMISDTNWDRTDHWRNIGTKTSQEWQYIQGGIISIGPRERYRIYNNKLRIFAALTTPYNFAFEYKSNFWVIATGGSAATKATYTVDSDTAIFQDNLLAAGLKYYFLKAKKLDFGIELAEFKNILSTCKAQDVPVSAMSLSPTRMNELVGPWSVQDGNWPTS